MARILSVPERIRLFKEINRVHREIYGSRMLYRCVWGGDYINIESDVRLDYHGEWVPMDKSDAGKYYFHDYTGKDIRSLRGIFAWEAYAFYHLNPYSIKYNKNELADGDFISDGLGKRVKPDVSRPVHCLETTIEVQQRKEDEKIWISSSWLYPPDFYGSSGGAGSLIRETLNEAARGDKKVAEELQAKYEEIADVNRYEFKKALERYFRGGKLQSKYWYGGYLFAASKERRIKTLKQLNEAMKEEEKHFQGSLEAFIDWFSRNGLNLVGKAKESLRRRMREFYAVNPCNIAKDWCKFLVEEDKTKPSDIYLWWGGEPNGDLCYAFLTLFFEVDPNDIGTSRFDKKVSSNLKALINIAEKDRTWLCLSYYKRYEPDVWRIIFS